MAARKISKAIDNENKSKTTKNPNTKTTSVKRGSKSTSSGKKTTQRKSHSKTKKNIKTSNGNKIVDEFLVLIACAITLLLFLSNYNLAGSFGNGIKWLMFGLLGVMEYIFPFILGITIVFMISNKDIIAVARIKTIAVYVLMILLSAAWQRINNNPDIASTSIIQFYLVSANDKVGGGFFGGLLCKIMAPLGTLGTMVILIIFAILCIVIITERSFINGIRNIKKSGTRMAHVAKQDYDMYREHSNEHISSWYDEDIDNEESEAEYLARRRKLKEEKRRERLLREQQDIKAREERAKRRMAKKARGITVDTELPRELENIAPESIDIHEIMSYTDINDQYSQDIYEPDHIESEKNTYGRKTIEPSQVQSSPEFNMTMINTTEELSLEEIDILDEEDVLNQNVFNEHMSNQSIVQQRTLQHDELHQNISKNLTTKEQGVVETKAISEEQQRVEPKIIEQSIPVKEPKSVEEHRTVESQKSIIQGESNSLAISSYKVPPMDLLSLPKKKGKGNIEMENKATAIRLQQTLQNFGVKVTITNISCGPSVTRYELQPEQGVKVSKIVSLADDIKLNLAAADIRIEAPIPGKAAIGIEVPNKEAGSVGLRELLEDDAFTGNSSKIAFAAGKDIAGKPIVADIAKMPHLLIAGATGSGKSVCINTIIMSILYKARPDEVKLIMVDPKVVELSVYNGIPHLLAPVVTDPKKASGALNWAVAEMTDRYKKFAQMGVRNLKGYNAEIEKISAAQIEKMPATAMESVSTAQTQTASSSQGQEKPEKMPEIVIIIDELADLMMVAPGEVEDAICRLAQLARAAGIHLVIATQRPSVNVITGIIKANVPSRIAFSVSSGVDSRTIIDMNGAEKLLGKGDMLFFPSGYPKPVRVQGAFVSDEEVSNVVDYLKQNMVEEVVYNEDITNVSAPVSESEKNNSDRDSLFEEAGRFVIEKDKGSIGMLQRYFKIGFNRAGRIMDQLAEMGVVGPEIGTKARKILMTEEEFENLLHQ